MWRRHGCRRKPAHETENNLFIKGWDAGCGGKLCSQAVDTEWGLLGWLPSPHHCHGSMMVASPKKFGKEICAFPKREGRSGTYAQARQLGAPLCLSVQDSARNKVGTSG